MIFSLTSFGQTKNDEKMTAEKLVSLHLASIGTTEDLAAAKTRVVTGRAKISSKLGFSGEAVGPAQLASEGEKFLFATVFNSNNYPFEKGAYDGKDVSIGRPLNGNRTLLGDYLKAQNVIMKDGMFGGALSSAWALLNVDQKKAKLDYQGVEKVGDRQFHKLKYRANRSRDLIVTMYFEADTYRHVMTKYEYNIAPRLGSNSITNSSQKPTYYTMTEQFGDFAVAGKLTLPKTYVIEVTVQNGESGTLSMQLLMNFSEFYFNEKLDAATFNVS